MESELNVIILTSAMVGFASLNASLLTVAVSFDLGQLYSLPAIPVNGISFDGSAPLIRVSGSVKLFQAQIGHSL